MIIILVLLSYFYVSTYNINTIDTTNLQDVHREFDLNQWASCRHFPPSRGPAAARWDTVGRPLAPTPSGCSASALQETRIKLID